MKNKISLIESKIKPDKKLLDVDIKYSISTIFKREVQKDRSIVWVVKIQPQIISDQENEVKNPTTKDLYDLIEKQIVKSSNLENKFDSLNTKFDSLENKFDSLENKFDSLNTKFDNHIVEFNSFKSDMLEFKSDMLSLPTISKELKNKNR